MEFSLVMVGAHNGSKTVDLVRERDAAGPVLLIEPIPYLFNDLKALHAELQNISFLNCCVAEADAAEVSFFAPGRESNSVVFYGDQLGSLDPHHAASHHSSLRDFVTEIKVEAVSFTQLLDRFDITGIDILYTDTEGFDARLLVTFPF